MERLTQWSRFVDKSHGQSSFTEESHAMVDEFLAMMVDFPRPRERRRIPLPIPRDSLDKPGWS
jgi:hypothetical protein